MQTEEPESETVKPTLARGQPAYVSSCFACVSESPRASCLVILSNQRYISAILVLWSIFQITAFLVRLQCKFSFRVRAAGARSAARSRARPIERIASILTKIIEIMVLLSTPGALPIACFGVSCPCVCFYLRLD